jgi:hypothetical protein
MNDIKDMGSKTYEIKKIILADGTEFDIDKIVGFTILKYSGEGNNYKWKIHYCAKSKLDLKALSNQCTMAAYAFSFMARHGMKFDEACKLYDEMMEEARRNL